MLSPLPPPRIPPSSHTRRSQKPPGSTKTQMSPLPESLPAASPTCQELGFLGVFFFLQIPIKRATGWATGRCPGRGAEGPCQSQLSGGMFSAAVCCCWWGAPGVPFGHRLLGEKLNPKGRGGRRRGWSRAGSMGRTQHPPTAAPWQGTGHGHSRGGRRTAWLEAWPEQE